MSASRMKGRRVRMVTRKWTHDEEAEVLDYIRKFQQRKYDGQEFSDKPSASYFFQKMSSDIKFDVVSASQMRNKIRNLQQKYIKAVEIKKNNDHLTDEQTLKENMLSICPHWYALHEIFGTTASTQLPFQFSKCSSQVFGDDDDDNNEHVRFSQNVKFEPNSFLDESAADSDCSVELSQTHTSSDSFQFTENSNLYTNYGNIELPRKRKASVNQTQENGKDYLEIVAKNHDNEIIPRYQQQEQQQKQNQICESNANINRKKMKTEDTNAKHEWKCEEIKLAKGRFEFEKMFRLQELTLKKCEIESNEKLRILQLEKEERMERLKLELEFKVQMAKLKQID